MAADIVAFASGCSIAWSSPAIAKLKENDPSVNPLGEAVTPIQESWITALLYLGAAIGPLFIGKAADSFGRKKSLIILSLPMIASFVILAFATNITFFYIARFALGLGVGSTFSVLPLYLGEITENHNRGKFGCIMAVFITLGILYPFVVGSLLSLKLFSISCALPLMLFLIFFTLFIPDSPIFLISINSEKEAMESLRRFRNKSNGQIQKELSEMSREIEKDKVQKGGIKDLFKVPNLRNGLVVSLGLIILQQFAGINAVLSFMGQIFDASGSDMSTYMSTILIGLIQVASTILTSATVEKLGRKPLLLVSSIGSCSSILIIGLYFYLKKSKIYNVESLFWLPVVCLMIYIISFNVGLGPLPWTIVSEIFPPNVKSEAAALTAFVCFLASFVVTLGFPTMAQSFGMAQCFWLFGFCCILGSIFIYAAVPETKGKTLSEIQQVLTKMRH